ncbi:hypothetical protein B0A54_11999 [Friedmanniomyces endolithicus]|uniref:Uncharacterized protein n=1 Tax=Friedmanniomyces endolithicus TaxID=329885 RepID=A0A4U0UMT3_9PEZI|nr:hypothetical protein LTS09_010116 [Friedmanniomyces endolithicus]KAK0308076.1 hypothetical protein LTR01_005409 [Friedmanniomyces endolithicus]KAK0831565.1 hypothetical protein LTR73_002948 [Friedmanniomyces endolithicus]TKA37138.1 hypothetical protein B0A54_11999 [Friedmanniomyces endolithicus]
MTCELWEGSPPYMHTHHLSEPEETHCLQNPTYASRLHAARARRQEIQYRQIALDVSRRTGDATKRQLENREKELHALEDGFVAEDRVLAGLAEALVRCPMFWHTQEVRLVVGRWMWALPAPEQVLRVDRVAVVPEGVVPMREAEGMTFKRQPGPTPARKLSQRLSRGLSRLLSGRRDRDTKRLKKVRPAAHF